MEQPIRRLLADQASPRALDGESTRLNHIEITQSMTGLYALCSHLLSTAWGTVTRRRTRESPHSAGQPCR